MSRPQEEARDMAYDEPTFRRHGNREPADRPLADDASSRSNGLSTADYRGRRRESTDPLADKPRIIKQRAKADYDTSQYQPGGRSVTVDETGTRLSTATDADRRNAATMLSQGTDDQMTSARDSGRDRLGIHFGWEAMLVLAVAAIGYLMYRLDPGSLKRPALDTLLINGTAIGLLALGAGLSLRAGVVNLAVGPIAVASALHFAENSDRGVVQAALPAVGVAAVGGLLVAVLVLAFHVPGWAASLAGAMGVIVFIELRTGPVEVQGTYDPSQQAYVLFGGFALLAVLGGGLGTVAPLRRLLGRMRPVEDPALRTGGATALPVIGALVVSSVLAVGAGVLMAANSTVAIKPSTGLQWTGLGVGLALVAGTSAYGRRGGVFGTLLAVTFMALFLDYADRRDFGIALFATAACTVAVGLVVTRLIETYGRPTQQPGVGEDWQGAANGENWQPDMPETWSPSVPAQAGTDRWLDDRWGQSPR
jgi:ribose/xylose/arabinose/galactoside ABC-type transport system permease subunit